jgi:type I restriction enzyme, S subunit
MHVIYPDPLPTGWNEEPLGALVTTKRGCSWAKEQERDRPTDSSIPVIRIPNINETLDLCDLLHIEGVLAEERAASAVTKGWTLLVGSNGNPKRIGDSVLMEEDREMIFASFLFALRPKPDRAKITDEFLACWLQAHRVHEFISETSQMTTGLANMSWSACRRLPVRYPQHKDEQTRIAETLKAADNQIRSIKEQRRQAELAKRALIETGTTVGLDVRAPTKTTFRYRHPFACNAAWNHVELRTLKPQIAYGTNQPSNDYRAGVPVVAIPQVLTSRFAMSELPFAEVTSQEQEALSLQPHDVLLVRTNGNPSYIGRSTVIPEGVLEVRTIFASYLIRVRVNQKLLRGAFLNYVLQSHTGRRQSNSLANTSAGNFNLAARSLSKFLIPLPEPEEQDDIVNAINAADDLVLGLDRQLTTAGDLKRSLLQTLLTGKVCLSS